jgi:diadenosine tetraphosphate (Ap4A) HIT family hydrolase
MRFLRSLPALALLLLPLSRADVRSCLCDVAVPATLEAHECGLCKEAEKQPANVQYFFLRDANPTKPHRWLVLPRFHGNHPQQLSEMTPEQRTGYWTAAIAKAREVWGDQPWGVALNSTAKRSQCHVHMHIGKLLPDAENDRFVVVYSPAEIPVPKDGDGVWIHAVDGRLHVHTEEPNGELKLER